MPKTITHKDNTPYFGEDPLLEIAPNRSFTEMIFELLSGKKPSGKELKLFETILNISIDHGVDTPSAIEVIKSAKEGKTISESVASGIIQVNDTHGGAGEPAMELFYEIESTNKDVAKLVDEYINAEKRLPGFGHRIYEVDPRTELIFKIAEEEGLETKFIDIAKKIQSVLSEKKDRAMPINVDGAIAAVLCTFGWPKELGKAVFIIARTPGLCGQYLNSSK